MNFSRAIAVLILLLAALLGACRKTSSGIIVLCAGDSLTEQGYPRYLRAALGRRGVKARVINHGRSGNTSREYLSYLRLASDKLGNERPDIVLIELGTNDVRVDGDDVTMESFEENLRAIVGVFRDFRTRAGGRPEIFLAAIPPVPEGMPFPFGSESRRRVTAEINPVIRAVSLSMKTEFVDNYSLFVSAPALLPEVHPSDDGYRAMADNWARAILLRFPPRSS